MPRDDNVITAYHETGHAIMAMACGYPVSKISIESNEDSKGHTIWSATDEPGSPLYRRKSIAIFIGGMVTDSIHWEKWGKGSESDMPLGWFDDQARIRGHLTSLQEHELIEAYMAFARLYLSRPDVWFIVELVAELLLKIGTIDGFDFLEGIRKHCPELTDHDWAGLEAIKGQLALN